VDFGVCIVKTSHEFEAQMKAKVNMNLNAQSIEKYFGEKLIFKGINFNLHRGQSLAITGPNGSGKTTLMRILCGLIRPSAGKITYEIAGERVTVNHIYRYTGLVGPYLELYEELTAIENLSFFAKMRNLKEPHAIIMDLIERVGLIGRENDPVKNYSSGMRQRLKYAFALLHQPQFLLLDEPTSNLDAEGTSIVYDIMKEQKENKILIVATNDQSDLKYGDYQIAVDA
jgi:heme exporter protein A